MTALTRRAFLTLITSSGLTGALGGSGPLSLSLKKASAQTPRPIRLAHISHRDASFGEGTSYAIMGAQLGAEEANTTAEMLGSKVELSVEETPNADRALAVARTLTARGDFTAIVGALDDAATADMSALTQQAKHLLVNAAAQGSELRGKHCHRYTFHVIADRAMHVDTIAQWLLQQNQTRWFFLLPEGPQGQEVYHRARRLLQARGGSELGHSIGGPPPYDYGPLLGNLARQDVEVIFIALTGETLREFLEQYRESNLGALVAGAPLDIITLWDTPWQHVRGVWAASWYHELVRFSARELNKRFMQRFGKPAEAYAWANWAAVKLVVEGVLRTGNQAPLDLVTYLESAPAFDGHKGKSLTFREWNHQLRQPLYVLKSREAKPENARDLFELVTELPASPGPGTRVWEALDTLGESQAESRCHLEAL